MVLKGYSVQEVNGVEYPMKWGLNQSMFYCELRKCSIDQMNEELREISSDMTVLRDILWSAFKDGARVAKKEFDLTNYDIADLMEEMSVEEMEKMVESMTETLPRPRESKKKK